jgi:hypothetical protein
MIVCFARNPEIKRLKVDFAIIKLEPKFGNRALVPVEES